MRFISVFNALLRNYGAQQWWPGETPFEVMVGAVLTQNTAWSNVEQAIANLKQARALEAEKIVEAPHARLAAWIRPAGYFNVKAKRLRNYCAWYLEQGEYHRLAQRPTTELREDLLSVNGVGPETADDILLYAFEREVFVIDAYTRRLFSRLALVQGDETYEELRACFESNVGGELGKDLRYQGRKVSVFNEYHALIVRHAKEACRKRPQCEQCCLRKACRYPGS